MRFYKNRQSEMLHSVAFWLKKQQDELSDKVPALRDFIAEFAGKEKELYDLKIANPSVVKNETLKKGSFKEEFVEVVMKLLSVVKAATSKNKNEKADVMHYTQAGLNRLTAEKLCEVYRKTYDDVKKIKTPQYFGLSPQYIKDSQVYYKEFSNIKNAPAERKKEVTSRNDALNEGVKECIVMLEESIDPLMVLASEGNREMRMKYKSLRRVLGKAGGRPSDKEAKYLKSRKRKTKK